jgi:hypothetical protein
MSLNNRQTLIDRFQEVASQTELTEELAAVVELLKLPLSFALAVQQVLREGNWAKAEYPRAYLRRAAMTQARKMHLSIPHNDDTLECGERALVFMGGGELDRASTRKGIEAALDSEDREHGTLRPKRRAGKQYVSAQFDPDDEVWDREIEAAESGPCWPSDCWTVPEVPEWLLDEMKSFHEANPDECLLIDGPSRSRDWKRLGEKAGLDALQIKVLEYRSQGISRDSAMELQPDDASRKAIQAAWKRFDRTGLKKVQDFLDKTRPWDVPEEHLPDTRKVEATACSPAGRLRAADGKALQAIWKRREDKSREGLGKFLSAYRAAVNGRGPTQLASLVKIIDSKCPE